MGARDLPSEAEEAAPGGRAGDGGADRSKARETPDPDERGQAYEAVRAHVSAETREEAGMVPARDRGPEATDQRSYRTEVGRFQKEWAEHEKRWAIKQQAADGRSPATPERHAETVEVISRVRQAESTVSKDARVIRQENDHGGWLEGFQFRLKGEDRLNEKVAEKLKAQSDRSPTAIIQEIPDAIRYTFCLEPRNYTAGYYDIKQRFEDRGYEMYYSKNWWSSPEYKGINTRWLTQDGERFEIQFHTPDSFHAKHEITHDAYKKIRNRFTLAAERKELKSFQSEVSSWVQVPDGARDIPDYEKKGF